MRRVYLLNLLVLLTLLPVSLAADLPAGMSTLITWSPIVSLPRTLTEARAATDGRYLYVTGGAYSSEVYYARINDNGTLTPWVTTTPLPRYRWAHSAVVSNGYLLVIGGYYCCWGGTNSVISARIQPDGTLGSWQDHTPLPNDLYRSATVAYNGHLYVIGGWRDWPAPGSPESKVYWAPINPDGTIGTWTTLTSLPKTLHAHSAVTSNGYIYVIGGKEWLNAPIQREVYRSHIEPDGTIGSWTQLNSLPIPLHSHSATVWKGKIVVTGGRTAALSGDVSSTYVASIQTNGTIGNWSNDNALPKPLVFHSSVSGGTSIYVIGGYSEGQALNEVYCGQEKSCIQFLDLPFTYNNFADAASRPSTRGGRVNSWFDHHYPNGSTNNDLQIWTGLILTRHVNVNDPLCLQLGTCYDGHNAIDFSPSAPNTPARAAAKGKVKSICIFPANCGRYGQRVDVDHQNGYLTRYAHLASVNVNENQMVNKGDPIGIIGSTGNSTGPHLHFGVYFDKNNDGQWSESEAVDPFGWKSASNDPWVSDLNGPTSYYLWLYPISAVSICDPTSGVTVTSPSGSTAVNVPPNACPSTLTIDLTEGPVAAPSAQLRSTGRSFSINATPSGQSLRTFAGSSITLTVSATLTVNYTMTDTTHLSESSLGIYRWDENASIWNPLTTTVDTQNKKTTAQTDSFGKFALFAPPLCATDIYEPNDDYSTANAITTDGRPQSQLFDISNDQDWIKFNAAVGITYVIRTSNLGTSTDTVITLYERDGITPIATDDNSGGGKASLLTWRASAMGTYFVKIQNASPGVSGCNLTYDVSIRGIPPIFLPFITR